MAGPSFPYRPTFYSPQTSNRAQFLPFVIYSIPPLPFQPLRFETRVLLFLVPVPSPLISIYQPCRRPSGRPFHFRTTYTARLSLLGSVDPAARVRPGIALFSSFGITKSSQSLSACLPGTYLDSRCVPYKNHPYPRARVDNERPEPSVSPPRSSGPPQCFLPTYYLPARYLPPKNQPKCSSTPSSAWSCLASPASAPG